MFRNNVVASEIRQEGVSKELSTSRETRLATSDKVNELLQKWVFNINLGLFRI